MKKYRKQLLIFSTIVILLVGMCVLYIMNNGQREACFSDPNTDGVMYRSQEGMIEIDSGLVMVFDTGSSISTITPEDLEYLKKIGMKVDSVSFPAVGFDTHEKLRYTSKRYKVSLPAYRKTVEVDTATNGLKLVRVPGDNTTLDNLLFFPTEKGENSTLGMDILEMFCVERLTPSHIIAIRNSIPRGYQEVVNITTHPSWKTVLGIECRYYINMLVDSEQYSFFINSGTNDVVVRMPMRDTLAVHGERHPTLMQQHHQVFKALEAKGWMQIGTMASERDVTFTDAFDNEEAYSINPAKIFDSDVIFDYRAGKMYTRPNNFN